MCLYGDKTIKDKDNNRAHSTKGVDADATLHIIQIKEHSFFSDARCGWRRAELWAGIGSTWQIARMCQPA